MIQTISCRKRFDKSFGEVPSEPSERPNNLLARLVSSALLFVRAWIHDRVGFGESVVGERMLPRIPALPSMIPQPGVALAYVKIVAEYLRSEFFWRLNHSCAHQRSKSLNVNDGKIGSKGRTRTYNRSVNSRLLYH